MKRVEDMGVEMPKYYKAGAINPVSYAEQVQKRKMMWKKQTVPAAATEEKKSEEKTATPSFNKWEATNFGNEEANSKFRRLMGIKSTAKPEEIETADAPGKNSAKLMSDLERGYEQARQQTHRNRGIGLGFSSSEEMFSQGVSQPRPSPSIPQVGPAAANRPTYGMNFVKKM